MDIFVARQPILDTENNAIGYELFYRDGINNFFNKKMSGNAATAILLTNSYLSFGMENLVGDGTAYLNFDDYLINYGIVELLNKDNVVIEILESVIPTQKLIDKISKLVEMGYVFAIDDYSLDYKYQDILNLCSIIKVDFKINSYEDIIKISDYWGNKGKILLAEKVETLEEFELAKHLKFKYFQGYFFEKPTIQKRKTFTDSARQYINLMNELSIEEPDFNKISKLIEIDVSLSYKLLKLVNSNTRLHHEIKTISHAVSILGLKSFRRWLSLAMVQNIGMSKVSEVLKNSLIRYHMLSNISENSIMNKLKDELSLMGTLSNIDVLLEMNMNEVLDSLSLSDDFKNTLLFKTTKFSDAYLIPLEYEKGNFQKADDYSQKIKYDTKNIANHYFEAVKWADKTYNELNIDNGKD